MHYFRYNQGSFDTSAEIYGSIPLLDGSNPNKLREPRKYFTFTSFTTLTSTQFATNGDTTVSISVECIPANGLTLPPCAK